MGDKTEHNALNEIFSQALELDKNQRQKLLDRLCQNKPDLRQKVEDLLKSHQSNDDFLENNIADVVNISFADNETTPLPNAEKLAEINWKQSSKSQPYGINPKSLRGDLDNIVLMALRKETDRRYASVEDLSKDISNYLNGLPVSARPNTFSYRASKFYTRNKTASIVGILLVLSLSFGIIATSRQAILARQERDLAQQRFAEVRQLSNSLLFEITPKIERLQGSTEARQILVKRALEYLDRLSQVNNNPTLQLEVATAYSKIGEIQGDTRKPNLGDFEGAKQSYQKANSILQNLPQTLENQKLFAENLRQLAKVEQNDIKASISYSEQAIKIYNDLFELNPNLPELKLSSIETQSELAQHHTSNSDFKSALNQLSQTLPELETLDQNIQKVQELNILALTQKSFALSWENRQSEAEIEMNKAILQAEKLARSKPNDVSILQVLWEAYYRSSAIYETIKDDISLEFANKAVKIKLKSVEIDASDIQSKHNLARSYSRVALALSRLKRTSEALENWKKAETILVQLANEQPKNPGYQGDLATLYYRIGTAEKLNNSFENAASNLQKSLQYFEEIYRSDKKNNNAFRHIGLTSKHLGDVYAKLSKTEEAQKNYQKAFEIINDLKTQNKLPDFDQKMLDELQKLVLQFDGNL